MELYLALLVDRLFARRWDGGHYQSNPNWIGGNGPTVRLLALAAVLMEGGGVASASRLPAATMAFANQEDGSYLSAEAHVHLFEAWHEQLDGAVLKTLKTFVLDTDKDEGKAHITCKPPHGAVVQPNKQRQRRCLNDIKQLNSAGLMALQHNKRKGKGLLSKHCVAWRITRRCVGTVLCDAHKAYRGCHCVVTVEYSATIEDVHQQQVRIKITGVQGANVPSLHSATRQWDPARLRALHAAQAPARNERLKRAAEDVWDLKTQLVKSEQRLATEDDDHAYNEENDSDSTVADWRAEHQGAKRLRSEIGDAERELHEAQRDARPTLTSVQRSEVHRLMSEGHMASTIQSMLAHTSEPPPTVDAIHYTMDNEWWRTRCGLEAYEAMHWMCRDLLADQQRVMLYLVHDPDIDPDDYPNGLGLPVGALHLVMCATVDMVDALSKANGIGVDTKWRTWEDKGCVHEMEDMGRPRHLPAGWRT